MKAGILITSISNFGEKGFYNSQEIGLAKALSNKFEEIIIYKLCYKSQKSITETVEGFDNIKMKIIAARNIGINGIIDINILNKSIDILIYFSDTQLCVPRVYKWCLKNNVKFVPYIGAVESHSSNKINKFIINLIFNRNINVYKRCNCKVKTPKVGSKLMNYGVKNIAVAPVGLDMSLLKNNYKDTDKNFLKNKWGYKEEDKIILFIGRLEEEKRPIEMLEIIKDLYEIDNSYKLLMVGKGRLKDEVNKKIKQYNLQKCVKLISDIKNSNIWEIYCMSEAFINLNRQEIFGMSILEAMYYECKVIAWHAPGPDFIIDNNISGYLVSSNLEVINCIKNKVLDTRISHEKIINNFTWENTAEKISI